MSKIKNTHIKILPEFQPEGFISDVEDYIEKQRKGTGNMRKGQAKAIVELTVIALNGIKTGVIKPDWDADVIKKEG